MTSGDIVIEGRAGSSGTGYRGIFSNNSASITSAGQLTMVGDAEANTLRGIDLFDMTIATEGNILMRGDSGSSVFYDVSVSSSTVTTNNGSITLEAFGGQYTALPSFGATNPVVTAGSGQDITLRGNNIEVNTVF